MVRVRTDVHEVGSLRPSAPADTEEAPPEQLPMPEVRLRIHLLILHALDPRTGSIQLVDEVVALDEQSALFFAGHIAAAEQRADWRARFREPGGEVPLLCRRLLGDAPDFVDASQRLAQRLYDQMRQRPNQITPGDFVAVVYQQADDPGVSIALLKLDPDHRLVREFSRSGGRLRVSIRTAGNLLPETRRLQKCALLRARANDFDVTLLDTQAGPRSDGVAAFFYRGFLDAGLMPSARRRTRLFLTASDTWISQHARELSPTQLLTIYHARRQALAGESLDLGRFAVAALPQMPQLAATLLAHLRKALFDPDDPSPSFAVDRAVADPVVRCVTLELDGGTRLTVEAERFEELVRVGARRADGKLQLTLETLTLREVSNP
ncbi:MAG TPA: nucleoid-associated protein [Ktedonobacterales bacterium]|nr:nucleoid-associated protein [Ktedonobacterales bacterium]